MVKRCKNGRRVQEVSKFFARSHSSARDKKFGCECAGPELRGLSCSEIQTGLALTRTQTQARLNRDFAILLVAWWRRGTAAVYLCCCDLHLESSSSMTPHTHHHSSQHKYKSRHSRSTNWIWLINTDYYLSINNPSTTWGQSAWMTSTTRRTCPLSISATAPRA